MNRRDLLRNLGFGAAALVLVGAVAVAEEKKKSDVVAPILMERVCDGGELECDPRDWAEWESRREASGIPKYWCGTRFQWYYGPNPVCPKCFRTYLVMGEHMDKYKVSK